MKIEFSKKELKDLVELLYIASMMVSFSEEEVPDKYKDYQNIINKIYQTAVDNGLKDMVNKNEDGNFEPSIAVFEDQTLWKIMDNYDDNSFWELLIGRLARRDIMESMTAEEYQALPPEKQFALQIVQEDVYVKEFEDNGILNLRI